MKRLANTPTSYLPPRIHILYTNKCVKPNIYLCTYILSFDNATMIGTTQDIQFANSTIATMTLTINITAITSSARQYAPARGDGDRGVGSCWEAHRQRETR